MLVRKELYKILQKMNSIDTGTGVTVTVPNKIDKGLLDKRNLLGKVLHYQNGVYILFTLRKAVFLVIKFKEQRYKKCQCRALKSQCQIPN